MYDSHSNTTAVQDTNDDASASKFSCVKKRYMKDYYIHLFVRRRVGRSPIINRGYFACEGALRKLLYQFLDVDKKSDEDASLKKQILSLAAGFGTTYFQLQVTGHQLLLGKDGNDYKTAGSSNSKEVLKTGHSGILVLLMINVGLVPHEKRG
ncbi:unnamed protein product [Sphenostylis stenocarpa]|uniref:Uncharacterized protein n=1 Tax=Sphenostylis stenocarpa TaxID=92480 RepID=A0AA86RUF9_9FABA|nr:unnamed protein product [Sphenostylis stenocarpa]